MRTMSTRQLYTAVVNSFCGSVQSHASGSSSRTLSSHNFQEGTSATYHENLALYSIDELSPTNGLLPTLYLRSYVSLRCSYVALRSSGLPVIAQPINIDEINNKNSIEQMSVFIISSL